jgi:hypothetical protein
VSAGAAGIAASGALVMLAGNVGQLRKARTA